ncbi:uncharacterized protein LOC125206401 [Salvia hispanica]|uniref:uncharacterized protein LOC125206401 n=1 Tax=Salvia hispanica TaxID=49212 RepID=UPI00200962A9|nr:uncharacterized protein LOC125206401 [Salvia hispanica]
MAIVQRSRLEEEYLVNSLLIVDRISMLLNEILDIILSLLSLKEVIATSVLSSRWRRALLIPIQTNFPDNLKLLKKLSLHSVDVVNTSTEFKCLEISQCRSLTSVAVLESEVACIKYGGAGNPHCVFMPVHVPLLTELWIQAAPRLDSFKDIKKVLDMFGLLLPQLHKLKIYATSRISYGDNIGKIMPNLKELVVVLGCDYCEKCSILPWLSVAPALLLQRFVIEASHQETSKKCSNLCNCNWPDGWIGNVWLWERDDRICRAFPHIEEVEFVGYRGVFNHLQVITQFIKYDGALEKIIINPLSFKLSSCMPWDLISRNNVKNEISARNHAKDQLKDSTINVNIL